MNDKLYDFLYNKGQMTDSSECGSIIECLTTAMESRDQETEGNGDPETLADTLDYLDAILDEFEGWTKSLKEDLVAYRKKHVRTKKVPS